MGCGQRAIRVPATCQRHSLAGWECAQRLEAIGSLGTGRATVLVSLGFCRKHDPGTVLAAVAAGQVERIEHHRELREPAGKQWNVWVGGDQALNAGPSVEGVDGCSRRWAPCAEGLFPAPNPLGPSCPPARHCSHQPRVPAEPLKQGWSEPGRAVNVKPTVHF